MSTDNNQIKRFYKAVSIGVDGHRFAVMLDGRGTKTGLQNALAAPSEGLAQAVADEWAAQDEHIDRTSMPLTGILSAAIDGDEAALNEWRAEIIAYLNSDLLCYRAEAPEALASRQSKEWDPFLDWFQRECGVVLKVTAGIVAVTQPVDVSRTVSNMLQHETPETVFAMKLATGLTGSAVLALALWKKAFDARQIFEASRLDERFQEERWGADHEAKEREESLRFEFHAIERFLLLL